MWIVFDRDTGKYRRGAEWVSDIDQADRFSKEMARRLASVFSTGLGHDIIAEADAS